MKTMMVMSALALLFVPVAMAATVVDTQQVASVVPAPFDVLANGAGRYYVADDGSAWMESNGIAGLQEQAGHTQDGIAFAADTPILSPLALPTMPGLPGAPGLPGVDLPQIPL